MMEYKDMMKKERTIKGYDLVKAFHVADSYCDHYRVSGHKRDHAMLEVIVRSLMEDDLYEKLHQTAKESYERAIDFDKVIKDIVDVTKRAFGKFFPDKEEE